MAKAPVRQVFHSINTRDGWRVKKGTTTVSAHATQQQAEAEAIRLGRDAYARGGLGQAVLHKSDGTIREERTYGKDPERSPG